MKKILFQILSIIFLLSVIPSHSISQTTFSTNSPFELTLVVPDKAVGVGFDNVYVLLKNISDQPQGIVRPVSSWGEASLIFEVNIDGKILKIEKIPKTWHKNILDARTLQPGEYYVFDEHLMDGTWQGWNTEWKNYPEATLKAIYTSNKQATDYLKIWQGTFNSNTLNLRIDLGQLKKTTAYFDCDHKDQNGACTLVNPDKVF